MSENNLITIQQYAIKNKMSTFAVVKLVNAKKLKTIKKTVEGEEKEFIINDTMSSSTATTKSRASAQPASESLDINYEIEFHKLLAKYLELQAEYDALTKA